MPRTATFLLAGVLCAGVLAVAPAPQPSFVRQGTLDAGASATFSVHGEARGAIRVSVIEDTAKIRTILRRSGVVVDEFATRLEPKRVTVAATFATLEGGEYTLELKNDGPERGTYELTVDTIAASVYAADQLRMAELAARRHAFLTNLPADKSLYERTALLRAIDPDLNSNLGRRAPQMADAAFLTGRWAAKVHVFATPSTPDRPYRDVHEGQVAVDGNTVYAVDRTGNIPWIVYEPLTDRWFLYFHGPHPGIMESPGWKQGAITFEGTTTIAGVRTHWRQNITRRDQRHYYVLNEEIMADGKVVPLDEYEFEQQG